MIFHNSLFILLQAFFAASDQILHSKDATYETEVDAEIIGVGTITAFTIISPMILLSYALYGRKTVQGTHLDILFCMVGAILFITAGGIFSIPIKPNFIHWLLILYCCIRHHTYSNYKTLLYRYDTFCLANE